MNTHTPRLQKRTLLKVLLFCVSTVGALMLCEAVLRLALHSLHSKGNYIWPPGMKATFKPSPDIMPGVSGESEFRTNSQGIRGDEMSPLDTYRILAIGASTTECEYLDQSEIWTYLLQETMNKNSQGQHVWVGDGGVSGLTTRHHILAMQYLPLKEWKINTVVLLSGINDLSRRLSHETDYDSHYLEKSGAKEELLAQTFTGTYDSYSEDSFLKRTATWQLLRRMKRLMSTSQAEDKNGRIYVIWRQHRQHASELRDELPDLSSALEEYEGNLNRVIDIAHEKSVRLILITQPTLWRPDLPEDLDKLLWLGGIGDFQKDDADPYYSVAALEKGMKAYNDIMLRVARERHVEYLDLASRLEKDTTVFYDDVHFNESGSRKVAEILSQYMIEQGHIGGY